MRLNLARTLVRSAANGPGERFVLWVQGCPLGCVGCCNPDTWRFTRRKVCEVAELVTEIKATAGIEGVTFTGGEPFAQARALAEVARAVREVGLSVFVFSGYDLDELTGEAARRLLELTDVLVAGRYIEAQRVVGRAWLGSENQRVHFLTSRYGPADMAEAAAVEIHLGPAGELVGTGFPPDGLLSEHGVFDPAGGQS